MIKQILYSKLKQYGSWLFKEHVSKDLNTLHQIAQGYTETLQPTIKIVSGKLLDVVKQTLDEYVKPENSKDKKVVDADFEGQNPKGFPNRINL